MEPAPKSESAKVDVSDAVPPPKPSSPPSLRERVSAAIASPWVMFVRRFFVYIMTFVALYTIYKHVIMASEYTKGNVAFFPSASDTSATCAPLFDKAQSVLGSSSTLLYGYAQATPILRVCTDLTAAQVDKLMGANYRYSPVKYALSDAPAACPAATSLDAASLAALTPACTLSIGGYNSAFSASPFYAPNCSAALLSCATGRPAEAPEASPCLWQYGIGAGVTNQPCATEVYALRWLSVAAGPAGPPAPPCTKRYVWSMIVVATTAIYVTYAALAGMAVRLCLEALALGGYFYRGWKPPVQEGSGLIHALTMLCWGYLQRGGLLSAPFEAMVAFRRGVGEAQLPMPPLVACLVLGLDLLTHVAIPITTLSGCSSNLSSSTAALYIAQVVVSGSKSLMAFASAFLFLRAQMLLRKSGSSGGSGSGSSGDSGSSGGSASGDSGSSGASSSSSSSSSSSKKVLHS